MLLFYMMPEVLILTLLMLNEIKLRLIGLYMKDEAAIEPIYDGIQRNLEKGDEEAVEQKRLEQSNMFMERYFTGREELAQMIQDLKRADIKDIAFEI